MAAPVQLMQGPCRLEGTIVPSAHVTQGVAAELSLSVCAPVQALHGPTPPAEYVPLGHAEQVVFGLLSRSAVPATHCVQLVDPGGL